MISSSWGAPKAFCKGFNPAHVADGLYGQHLFVYDWPEGTLKQTLDLGNTGLIPLEVRLQAFVQQLHIRCILMIIRFDSYGMEGA